MGRTRIKKPRVLSKDQREAHPGLARAFESRLFAHDREKLARATKRLRAAEKQELALNQSQQARLATIMEEIFWNKFSQEEKNWLQRDAQHLQGLQGTGLSTFLLQSPPMQHITQMLRRSARLRGFVGEVGSNKISRLIGKWKGTIGARDAQALALKLISGWIEHQRTSTQINNRASKDWEQSDTKRQELAKKTSQATGGQKPEIQRAFDRVAAYKKKRAEFPRLKPEQRVFIDNPTIRELLQTRGKYKVLHSCYILEAISRKELQKLMQYPLVEGNSYPYNSWSHYAREGSLYGLAEKIMQNLEKHRQFFESLQNITPPRKTMEAGYAKNALNTLRRKGILQKKPRKKN